MLNRNAFSLWLRRYRHIVERRKLVDTYRRQKMISCSFHRWCDFVRLMKQRRVAAVTCLQSVLQKHTFQLWRWYTNRQISLRLVGILSHYFFLSGLRQADHDPVSGQI